MIKKNDINNEYDGYYITSCDFCNYTDIVGNKIAAVYIICPRCMGRGYYHITWTERILGSYCRVVITPKSGDKNAHI